MEQLLLAIGEDPSREGLLRTPERVAKAMAHIAYRPRGKVIGLSKLPRLLDVFARRLQVQGRPTEQVARAVEKAIRPRDVGVMLEAVLDVVARFWRSLR